MAHLRRAKRGPPVAVGQPVLRLQTLWHESNPCAQILPLWAQKGQSLVTGGRVERRLAAVLAADVAGYSRLMGADESDHFFGGKRSGREWLRREFEQAGRKHHGSVQLCYVATGQAASNTSRIGSFSDEICLPDRPSKHNLTQACTPAHSGGGGLAWCWSDECLRAF